MSRRTPCGRGGPWERARRAPKAAKDYSNGPLRTASPLPAIMREGLVGLRHAEYVVLALVRAALLALRVQPLVGEPLRHRLLAAVARELDQPAHGERAGAALGHLDRYLIGGAPDAARADLEHRRERLDGDLQRLHRILS